MNQDLSRLGDQDFLAWLHLALVALTAAQGLCMLVDEGVYHRRRGLGLWERISHPVDTFVYALCWVFVVTHPPSQLNVGIFCLLSIVSCLLITKDEWVHSRSCEGAEAWLHACLFLLHSPILVVLAVYWWASGQAMTGSLAYFPMAILVWGGLQLWLYNSSTAWRGVKSL